MNAGPAATPTRVTAPQRTVGARLRRGFGYSLVSQILVSAIGFVVAPVVARALSLEEYGVIGVVNAARSVLLTLLPMSAAGAVTFWYNLHRDDERAQRAAMGGIAGLALTTSTVWLALGIIAGPWLQRRFLPDFPLPFFPDGLLILGSAWFGALQVIPNSILGAAERMDTMAGITLMLAVFQGLLTITLVVFLRRSVLGQVEAFFYTAVAATPCFVWLMARLCPPRVDLRLWKSVAVYALPFLPHQISQWLLSLSDRLIIGHYGARFADDLGLYSFSYNVAIIMFAVLGAFNSVWAPVFLEQARTNPRAQEELGQTATWACVALAGVASGLVLMAPEAVGILGGKRYMGSVRYVPPVVIGFLMQGVYMFPAMSLYHVQKTARLPVVTVISGALNVGLNLVFIPRFGVIVAAWSTLASYGAVAVLAFLVGHPPYPLHYRGKPLIASALAILCSWIMMSAHAPSWGFTTLKVAFWLTLAATFSAWWRKGRAVGKPLADAT